MPESREQYVLRVIEELFRESKNGVLTKPHLARIFEDAEKKWPSYKPLKPDFKRMIKKKVLIDIGFLYTQKGNAISAFTNPENSERAILWKIKELRFADLGIQVEERDTHGDIIKIEDMPPVSEGESGADSGESTDPLEGSPKCGPIIGQADICSGPEPDGGHVHDEHLSLQDPNEQDPKPI